VNTFWRKFYRHLHTQGEYANHYAIDAVHLPGEISGFLDISERPTLISKTLLETSRCPLSALLFVLSVEIIALNLRSCKDIKGITVKLDEKNHSIKISQLADDTTLFCNSKEDVLKAINEIEIFGSFCE
jgi:hypothetical protein